MGFAAQNTIWIDDDAAGLGWFVDQTPWQNTEFEDLGGGLLRARRGSAADERVDLLTVLLHELGHVLGLEHSDLIEDELMDDLLGVGQRRLPTAEHVDAIFNSAE